MLSTPPRSFAATISFCDRVAWSGPRQYPADIAIVHHLRQSVGTQEKHVTRLHRLLHQVRSGLPVDAEGLRDHVAVGARPRLRGCEETGAHLLRNYGMVVRQLFEFSGPKEIGTAVADMREERPFPRQEERRQRRPHAGPGGILRGFLADVPVRKQDRMAERGKLGHVTGADLRRRGPVPVAKQVRQSSCDRIHGDAARYLAGLAAPDTVGNGVEPQPVVDEIGVLVVGPLFSRIGRAERENFHLCDLVGPAPAAVLEDELQNGVSDAELVAVAQLPLPDGCAPHVRAVGAVQVLEDEGFLMEHDARRAPARRGGP